MKHGWLAILLCSTAAISAGQQSGPHKDAKALGMIHVAQSASAAGIQNYRDVELVGTVKAAGGKQQQYPIVIKAKGKNFLRVEVRRPEGTSVRITGHGKSVLKLSNGSVVPLLSTNALVERIRYIPSLSFLSDADGEDVAVDSGPSEQPGTETVTVSLVPKNANPGLQAHLAKVTATTFSIDPASGRVTRMRYQRFAENRPSSSQTVEIVFDDYRDVDGIAVPFHQSTYMDGQLESEIVLDSAAFNVGVSETEFAIENK